MGALEDAEGSTNVSAAAEANGAGEDYGWVWKDLDKDFGDLAVQSGTLVPDGAADRFAQSAGPYTEIWSHTILIFRDPGTQIIDF